MVALLLAIAAVVSPAHAQQTELEVAYQREFAYLQAEKATLEGRLGSLASESTRRIQSSERELARLQSTLIELRSRAAAQEELLAAALRDTDDVTAARELIDATLFQASSSLGLELPDAEMPEAQAAALGELYTAGAASIRLGATTRKEPGAYFLADGTKVEGEIVRVGRIAAYGIGPRSGALLPVGEGHLALRDTEAADVATRLARGAPLDTVGLFAFEDNGKRVEEAPDKTLMSVMAAGGIIGWVIALLGLVGFVLAAMRAVTIGLAGRGRDHVMAVLAHLDHDQWEQAEAAATRAHGSASRVLAAMVPLGPGNVKRLEDRASEAILLQTPAIERFGTAIIVIAAVAPLLGLLGTVTGMIGTFEIITEFGTGDPRMLSGGISEALVTTQLGLIVAIPMLLLGNLLNQGAETVLSGLETAALAVINRAGHDDAQ